MRSKNAITRTNVIILVVIVIVVIIGGVVAFQLSTSPSTTSPSTTSPSSLTTSQVSSSASSITSLTSSKTQSSISNQSLTYDMWYKPTFIDPATDLTGGGVVENNVYETLVSYNGSSLQLIPWLAESYTISPNGTTYIFNLRQGITFCDGTQFNASAVKFNLDRVIIMSQPNSGAPFLDSILPGAAQYSASNFTQQDVNAYLSADAVHVISQYSVAVRLIRPDASFLAILAAAPGYIVSPSYVMAHGGITPGQLNQWMQSHACGTGPFNLQSYDSASGNVVLTRNDNYWGSPFHSGLAKLATVYVNIITNTNTRILDLESGAADIAYVPPTNILPLINTAIWNQSHEMVSTVPGVNFSGPYPMTQVQYIGMNTLLMDASGHVSTFQPFADQEVREGISYAWDAQSYINDVLNGFGSPANGPVPPGIFGHNSSLPVQQFNLSMAKSLLTDAGSRLGFSPSHPWTITANCFAGDTAGEGALNVIASNVNSLNVGINIQVQTVPFAQYVAEQEAGQIQMFTFGWPSSIVDPNIFLNSFGLLNGSIGVRVHFNNTQVANLIAQESAMVNNQTRANLVNQAVSLIVQSHVYIWRYNPVAYFAYRSNVHGFYWNPVQFNPTDDQFYFYALYKT